VLSGQDDRSGRRHLPVTPTGSPPHHAPRQLYTRIRQRTPFHAGSPLLPVAMWAPCRAGSQFLGMREKEVKQGGLKVSTTWLNFDLFEQRQNRRSTRHGHKTRVELTTAHNSAPRLRTGHFLQKHRANQVILRTGSSWAHSTKKMTRHASGGA
jgi:hypothetical protein